MYRDFEVGNCKGLVYYGNSDLLSQVAQELSCNPDSCLSKNILEWYTVAYATDDDFSDCRYQAEVNEDLCEGEQADSLEDLVNILVGYTTGDNLRVARAAIRVVCREALRQVTTSRAPTVPPN